MIKTSGRSYYTTHSFHCRWCGEGVSLTVDSESLTYSGRDLIRTTKWEHQACLEKVKRSVTAAILCGVPIVGVLVVFFIAEAVGN